MTKKNVSERKELAKEYYDKAFGQYPDWKDGGNLKPATVSQELAEVDLSSKTIQQIGLNDIQLSVICGTVLGDASLVKTPGYKNARIILKHSTRQSEWFMWKMFVILKDYCSIEGLIYVPQGGFQAASMLRPGETKLGKLQITSRVDQKFTSLHGIICKGERKRVIKRSWLNHMNNYFLMTLWLDDGSLIGNGRQGVICFQSTPQDGQEVLRDYLRAVWGIRTRLEPAGKTMANGVDPYRIAISDQDSLLKLLRLIAPIIPVREMLYKVCFATTDEDLLQRWRSELISLVRLEFKPFVEDYYARLAEIKSRQIKKNLSD